MKAKRKSSRKGKTKDRTAPVYPFEFRLRVVRLYLEDGYEASLLAQEFGISAYSSTDGPRLIVSLMSGV